MDGISGLGRWVRGSEGPGVRGSIGPWVRRSLGCWISLFGRDLQEDLLQTHAHRAQFEQSPDAGDNGAGDLATDVGAALALDLERTAGSALVRGNDTGDARDRHQRRR